MNNFSITNNLVFSHKEFPIFSFQSARVRQEEAGSGTGISREGDPRRSPARGTQRLCAGVRFGVSL